jgi:glycosyltransferase involved in cell wall biosynthesis
MAQQKCSIVIPVIPRHFHYLKKLLDELMQEDEYIGEIHVCASSVDQTSLLKLKQIIAHSTLDAKTQVHSCLDMKTAGENRNYGWKKAIFEIVVFLDADDLYYPKRLEVVIEVMNTHRADAVVHDYYRMVPKFFFTLNNNENYSVVSAEKLYQINRSKFEKSLPIGNLYAGESNLIVMGLDSKKRKVHHGHLTVRRDVPLRYTNRSLGEDGELILEILKSGYNLVYLPLKLSIYDRFSMRNLHISSLGHIRALISKIYRAFVKR